MNIVLLFSALLLHGSGQASLQPRSILIFGNTANALVQQQQQLLQKDSMGFAERDVHIKLVAAGSGLYKRYDVPVNEAMTIVLIGRDGGEKYRSNTLTTPLHFFTLIDGMPMRRAEMRNKKNDQR